MALPTARMSALQMSASLVHLFPHKVMCIMTLTCDLLNGVWHRYCIHGWRCALSRKQTGMTGGLCNDQLSVHPVLSSKTLNVDFFTSFSEISLIFEISPLQAVLLILSLCACGGVCMCMFAKVCVDCLSCCLTSTEARWPIRDGDRVGRGRESERLDCGNRPKKTGETLDCRQNNGSVKMVSPRHCPATCALRNCCSNCCAGQSHKDNVCCTAVDEQLGQLEVKDVQLAQPRATSLLMISSGQMWGSSSTSLL